MQAARFVTLTVAAGVLALGSHGCASGGADQQPAAQQPVATPAAPDLAAARPPEELIPALLQEFEGSYPVQAPPSVGLKTWKIVAAPARVEVLDGRTLDVWSYNGQVPGPVLRARLGETVRVELVNRLPQPTTIHWHGVRVPNAMDGVPNVTQPPVLPGESFVYEFVPKDAGTFWFHPHVRSSEQVERGLYGVLIVEDPQPKPYSQDVLWILDDWRLTPDGSAIDPNFNTRQDLMHDGRMGNVITVNGRTDEELTVKAGERIRLRIVNTANARVFIPDFSRLNAEIIAVDGNYAAEPFVLRRLEVSPGNRVDFDITFSPEDAGRVIPIYDRFKRKPNRLATIRVLDEVVETPTFDSPAAAHVPEWKGAESLEPTLEYRLNSRAGGKYGIEWTMNGMTYSAHERPNSLYLNEWAKIRFTNDSSRFHPMHMHGNFFRLLTRDGRRIPERFWRDTVLTRPNETIEIGLVPIDEGPWLLHCHILEHAAAGMMTIVDVKPREP